MITRPNALALAKEAAGRAADLARETERLARMPDSHHHLCAARFAQSGALWADVSRAYTALAAALPEPVGTTDAGER